MLFPIIRVIDNDSQSKEPHIVGTNSHDLLEIDKETGGIHYHNIQCCEGTHMFDGKSTFYFSGVDDDYWGPCVEMVSFERLCEIYLEHTRLGCEQEKKLRDFIKTVAEQHDSMIHESGLDVDDGTWNSGGRLL